MPSIQSRRWVYTLNNPTDAEMEDVLGWNVKSRYHIVGYEVGEKGTPHLQGFIIFDKPVRFNFVKELGARCHWEAAKGTSQQAADYCKKEGQFEEFGDMPDAAANGKAAELERWEAARTAAKQGRFDDVPADIFIRSYRTLKDIRKDYMEQPPDLDTVCGVWIYGPAGVGKSHKARAEYPASYSKMQNKWWDGYQGQDNVLLDDFDSKELGHLLKIWADKYAFIAETKGGAINIRPKKFIITSNYSIADMGWDPEMTEAITRRFVVFHMESEYDR